MIELSKLWQWLTTDKFGLLIFLGVAAFLEAYGDANWNTFLQGKGGLRFAVLGSCVLAAYGFVLNLPNLKFSELIGVYIVFFFLVAQYLAFRQTGQLPATPVVAGGILIVAGGLVIHLWKV